MFCFPAGAWIAGRGMWGTEALDAIRIRYTATSMMPDMCIRSEYGKTAGGRASVTTGKSQIRATGGGSC